MTDLADQPPLRDEALIEALTATRQTVRLLASKLDEASNEISLLVEERRQHLVALAAAVGALEATMVEKLCARASPDPARDPGRAEKEAEQCRMTPSSGSMEIGRRSSAGSGEPPAGMGAPASSPPQFRQSMTMTNETRSPADPRLRAWVWRIGLSLLAAFWLAVLYPAF